MQSKKLKIYMYILLYVKAFVSKCIMGGDYQCRIYKKMTKERSHGMNMHILSWKNYHSNS